MPCTRAVVLGLLAVTVVAGSGCVRRLATSTALIPPQLDKVLDERFKGWRLATFAGDATCQAQAGANPTVLSADFDSDGRDDRALLIETAQGTALVAGLRELTTFRLFTLEEPGSGTAAGRYLYLEPRGKRFPSGVEGLDDFLSHTTAAVATCGSAERVAFMWTGIGFKRVVMAATP